MVAGSNPVAPTRFVTIKHMVTYLLYLAAYHLTHIVHPRVAEKVADVITFFFYIFRRRIRHNVQRNLEALKVPDGCRFEVFRNFSRTLRDFLRLSGARREGLEAYCRIEGRENIDRALEEGRGAIIITPHLGPWEISGAYLASLGYRIHAVALPHPSKQVTRFFSKRRAKWGVHDYPLGDCIPFLLRALRMGDVVVLLVDRNFSRRGIDLPLLGRNATLPDGHIILAKRTGAPLVPAVCYYDNSHPVVVRIDESVDITGSNNDATEIGTRCIRRIERHIRKHYRQWFAFDHLWPES